MVRYLFEVMRKKNINFKGYYIIFEEKVYIKGIIKFDIDF